ARTPRLAPRRSCRSGSLARAGQGRPSDRGARGRRLPSFTFPESIVPRSLLRAGGTIDDKEFTALDEIRYQRHPLASGGDGKLMGRAIDQHPQRVRNVLLIK